MNISHEHEIPIVAPLGDLNFRNVGVIKTALISLQETGKTRIIVDLQGVDYIDSSYLGCLVDFHLKFKSKHGGVKLIYVPEEIQETFRMANLTSYLEMHETLEEALAAFRQTA